MVHVAYHMWFGNSIRPGRTRVVPVRDKTAMRSYQEAQLRDHNGGPYHRGHAPGRDPNQNLHFASHKNCAFQLQTDVAQDIQDWTLRPTAKTETHGNQQENSATYRIKIKKRYRFLYSLLGSSTETAYFLRLEQKNMERINCRLAHNASKYSK